MSISTAVKENNNIKKKKLKKKRDILPILEEQEYWIAEMTTLIKKKRLKQNFVNIKNRICLAMVCTRIYLRLVSNLCMEKENNRNKKVTHRVCRAGANTVLYEYHNPADRVWEYLSTNWAIPPLATVRAHQVTFGEREESFTLPASLRSSYNV